MPCSPAIAEVQLLYTFGLYFFERKIKRRRMEKRENIRLGMIRPTGSAATTIYA